VKLFQRIRRYSLGPATYLFAGVFLLRLLVLARLTASPFLLPSRGDMYFYNDWAQRILRGEWTDHLAFYGLPGYAYLLAVLYKLFGYSPFVPGFLQALLESGMAVLIYKITLRVVAVDESSSGSLPERSPPYSFPGAQRQFVALLAAFGWAFFVPAQAYSVILMPTVWLIFAFWLIVWRVIRTDAVLGSTECLLLGLLIGVTATGIATILFLAPLILAAALIKHEVHHQPRRRRFLVTAAVLFIGIGIGTSPCWIHNYFIARDPVFLSAHSGINFWIGNNPDANGYPRFPPGLRAGQVAMLQDSITSAESAAGRPLKRSEISAYWSEKARNYIVNHPLAWLRLMLIKLRNFWSAFRYDDLSIVTSLREQGVTLPGLYFGVVAAFALPGMFLGWRIAPVSRWIIAAILLHMVAVLTVFVTERYRLAIVPGLMIFAAFGLLIFWRSLLEQRYRTATVYLALLGASTIFVSWPRQSPSLWALDAYNSGSQAIELGREALERDKREVAQANFSLAAKKLGLAYSYVPDNAELNFALGELHQVMGDADQAKSYYATTLNVDPRHDRAFNNLGVLALEEHRFRLAESFFRHALDIDAHDSKTHFLLAKALLAENNREAAEREIEIAIRLSPNQSEFKQLRQQITHGAQP
jgi:tetratricopeptide (TPR) repeat protein